jgi:2-aminobenzoate-CoA ligase
MPLLRARELTAIVTKARISHALCDHRLAAELDAARSDCPMLQTVATFGTEAADGLDALAARRSSTFANVDTAADDTALIAFTSGTTGKPKGTMHFHRDVMAACDCWPRSTLRASPDDLFTGSPPLAFTFGLGGLLLFPLSIGAATLLLERPAPESLLPAIARHRVSVLVTAPTAYRSMAAQTDAYDLSSLVKCVSAGERRRLRRDTCGSRRPASRSSTASARPRCSTSSSRTTRRMRSPVRPAGRSRGTSPA